MAAPVYASDLVSIISDMASTTGWTALGGGAAGLTAPETDYFIQGSNCISKAGWSTATKGMIYNNGSGITVASGDAVWFWIYFWAPNSMAVENGAPGGMQAVIGSGTGAYKAWDVRGSDTLTYGGWVCQPIDPTITADDTTGSPTSTLQYFGATANVPSTGPSKGNPLGIDAMRYGRTFTSTNGDVNGYATFAGAATYNDDISRRYGQFQVVDGGYLMQGRFRMGSSGTSVDFRDSNRNIICARVPRVSSTFNEFEVVNASSRVDWTNISVTQLIGSPATASRARFVATNNADINLDSCSFTDCGTMNFGTIGSVISTTFRRCDLVTAAGATFDKCTFAVTNDSVKAVSASSPANAALITNSTFISGGTKHGLEITGTAANMTLTNVTWSGYAGTDGSTGNEAVYVNIASGSMNLTISGGTVPSVRTAGATVTVVTSSVTTSLTTTKTDGTALGSCQVLVYATSGGPLPANVTVTISNSGTTATVTHTGHGMITNDYVLIKGASHYQNNGVFQITKINNDSYSYTMGSAPGSSPTGTIKATFVALTGTTNATTGIISMSRSFSSNQPVLGWARKSTSAPYYKTATISGTINSSTGVSLTAVLIPDE